MPINQGTITSLGIEVPIDSSITRLRYFFGQLLTQRDLEAEQRYHLLLQRLTQREAFGTGTVAGLAVKREKDGTVPKRGVFIMPGLAMDPQGRELLLEGDVCVDVADEPISVTATAFPGPPTTPADLATELQTRFAAPISEADLDGLVARFLECGLFTQAQFDDYINNGAIADLMAELEKIPPDPPTLEPPAILPDWVFDQVVGVTFVGLRYREIGSEPSPAVLDASCCGDANCFPARTQEGVFIVLSAAPPPTIADPYAAFKLCLDTAFFDELGGPAGADEQVDCATALCECILDSWRGVPPVDDPCGALDLPVVPLARVCWRRFVDPAPTQILDIDNCRYRPLAPGVPQVRALVESLTGCANPQLLSARLVGVSPAHLAVVAQPDTVGTFELRATTNAPVVAGGGSADESWSLTHYPDDPNGSVGVFTPTAFPPGAASVATDIGSADAKAIAVTFAGSGATPVLEPGTYVWRIANGEAGFFSNPLVIESSVTGKQLDGDPHPVTAVPSGNGLQGGAFETRFVVKA